MAENYAGLPANVTISPLVLDVTSENLTIRFTNTWSEANMYKAVIKSAQTGTAVATEFTGFLDTPNSCTIPITLKNLSNGKKYYISFCVGRDNVFPTYTTDTPVFFAQKAPTITHNIPSALSTYKISPVFTYAYSTNTVVDKYVTNTVSSPLTKYRVYLMSQGEILSDTGYVPYKGIGVTDDSDETLQYIHVYHSFNGLITGSYTYYFYWENAAGKSGTVQSSFSVTYTAAPLLTITATSIDAPDGSIQVTTNVPNNANLSGIYKIIIQRRATGSVTQNNRIWQTVRTITSVLCSRKYIFYDRFVQSGTSYEYSVIPVITYGNSDLELERAISSAVFINLKTYRIEGGTTYYWNDIQGYDIYILEDGASFPMEFEHEIGARTFNLATSSQNMFGSRTPYTSRIGKINYLAGTEKWLVLKDENIDLYTPEGLNANNEYFDKLVNFLFDGKPKLLRGDDGTFLIINILNSPEQSQYITYVNGLWSISIEWVEVGDADNVEVISEMLGELTDYEAAPV